ncbi:hypothetical protein HYX03_04430 [Candidatus Woesearchaeota archaeon]|nr:hypothetical protein [Candidatus Woesearchaeota archaeon]
MVAFRGSLEGLLCFQLVSMQPTALNQFLDHQRTPIVTHKEQGELRNGLPRPVEILSKHHIYDEFAKLRDADIIAEQNPLLAIDLYKGLITRNGGLKETAIKRAGDLYFRLAFKNYGSNPFEILVERININDALSFYEDIIKNHGESAYVPEANLNLGKLVCCTLQNKDVKKGVAYLHEALRTGSDSVKQQALVMLLNIARYHVGSDYRDLGLRKTEDYSKELQEIGQKVRHLQPK